MRHFICIYYWHMSVVWHGYFCVHLVVPATVRVNFSMALLDHLEMLLGVVLT